MCRRLCNCHWEYLITLKKILQQYTKNMLNDKLHFFDHQSNFYEQKMQAIVVKFTFISKIKLMIHCPNIQMID